MCRLHEGHPGDALKRHPGDALKRHPGDALKRQHFEGR